MVHKADERLISRLQLFASAVIVAVMALVLGLLLIWQIKADYAASIAALEQQEQRRRQETLITQVENAKSMLENLRARTEELVKEKIRAQVDQAYDIAQSIYSREAGHEPAGELKKAIIETLRPLRFFEGKGYYFVDSLKGDCLLLPINPEREGSSLWNNRDDDGTYIMRSLIDAAQAPVGEGFSRYRWYAPGSLKAMRDKIAYVRKFEPYGWLIGSGIYLEDMEASLKVEALSRLRNFRFGAKNEGYLVVYAEDGRLLLSPSRPEGEGRSIQELPSDGRAVATLITEQAAKGDGFVQYDWAPDGGNDHKSRKMVYVSRMKGWGWVVSAGLYVDEKPADIAISRANLDDSIRRKLVLTLLVMGLGVSLALAMGWWFSGLTRRLVGSYQQDIARQNAALEEQTQELEQSNTDLEQFAYIASHDLREPLRMISAYIALIERKYTAHFDEDGLSYLGFARDGAKRMDQLVLDLLEFSRIDRQGAPIQSMPLAKAVEDAIGNLQIAIEDSATQITLPENLAEAQVMGDIHQITRLLQNLIGNAIKYRHPDRSPVIRISLSLDRDECWHMAIQDNGEGIDPRYFERIFGIFQRLHGREREGTGIGLAVCRRIVERHHGRIWLDSAPGEGTIFHFTLPAAKD